MAPAQNCSRCRCHSRASRSRQRYVCCGLVAWRDTRAAAVVSSARVRLLHETEHSRRRPATLPIPRAHRRAEVCPMSRSRLSALVLLGLVACADATPASVSADERAVSGSPSVAPGFAVTDLASACPAEREDALCLALRAELYAR